MKDTLWTPLYKTGQLMTLTVPIGTHRVLPLFTSPFACEAWIATMGWRDYYVSPPFFPNTLKKLVLFAMDNNFDSFTINPHLTMEVAPIDNLLLQVEAKI